jgi:SNF2 family DNA or RNA helicase
MSFFFKKRESLGWLQDDTGLAVFFHKAKDFNRAARGIGNSDAVEAFDRFERLLETGEASVEKTRSGIYLPAEDAVRLDAETRKCFGLPPFWPGYFSLVTNSIPNLSDFDAKLRLIGPDGRSVQEWSLRGGVLTVAGDHFLPQPAEFACLDAFLNWRNLDSPNEADHLRLIHVLTEAAHQGCRIDLSQVGNFRVVVPDEVGVGAQDQPDGSIILTPIPLAKGLPILLGGHEGAPVSDAEGFQSYTSRIRERIDQLESGSAVALLRIGSTIVLFNQEQSIQAKALARQRRVPPEEKDSFRKNSAKWLADHPFIHGQVEFLPRVIGIGEWTGSYLGAAGELGDKIDWFDKQPEAQKADDEHPGEISDENLPSGKDVQFDPNPEEPTGPMVPIIEANDEELRWGLHGERTEDPETVRIQPEFDGYPRKPFPHQMEAVLWLAGHSERCGRPAKWQEGARFWGAGALLADDMGLGKTLSTLMFLSMWYRAWQRKVGEAAPACLIVCPLSLIENWREEIEAAFSAELNPFSRVVRAIPDGDLRHYFATPDGKDRVKAKADRPEQAVEQYGLKFGDGSEASLDMPGTVVLTTYATLRDYRFSFAGSQWSAVIFDEAQNIKNPNALQTIAAKALKGFFRVALSGTPVENHLGDLWSLMDAVEPGALGSFREFRSKWIHPIRSEPSKLQVIGEALRKQLDRLILRRTKEESLKGLPSKHIIPVRIKMTESQAQLYDEILESVNSPSDDEETSERVNRWLACMWELRRISLHPALIGDAAGEPASNSRRSREFLCESAKLEWLLSQLDSIRGTGEKVLIFSVQKKLQGLLAAHLSEIYAIKIPIINGDTKAVSARASKKPNETRLGLISEFSKADGFGICILSPIAAGAGLNITAANHVIHLERHWNPAKEDQATDRAFRIGQTKDVNVYLPMLEHPTRDITTFDTGLDQLISRKKNLAGSLGLIPVQSVSMDEVFETVLKGVAFKSSPIPVFLDLEKACKLSWELFEALVAVIFDRESDRVILTSRGRDHGADVVVMGYGRQTNILIQVKTTMSDSLDSEQAIREVEGSLRFFESKLKVTFHQKRIHTNASHFSRRTRKAAGLYDVSLQGRDWVKSALAKHQIGIGEVIARNAQRKSL